MWKALAAVLVVFGTISTANAQSITDPNEIASHLHFWAQESGDPVYYGQVRSVDAASKRILGYYRCIAIAFIKYENGVFSYAHKMWGKSADGSCHYDDVTSRKVDNHGICVKDTDAGFGTAIGTARMTKDNIDYMHSKFRTIDTNTRRVGETAACVPPNGVGAGLYSISIDNGRLRVISTYPLDYEVNINPQDPRHPPTVPVF
ncbi:MAG: hypothetical protein JOY70_11560 [Acidisphaera sp.]|nr:hypothetical protein [Acidisphaera sp.]